MASREPVEAPEGTAARPITPDSSSTSHSTVGLPRLSSTSRPTMSTMALMVFLCDAEVQGIQKTVRPAFKRQMPAASHSLVAITVMQCRPSGGEMVFEKTAFLGNGVQCHQGFEQRAHVVQRHGIGPVGP